VRHRGGCEARGLALRRGLLPMHHGQRSGGPPQSAVAASAAATERRHRYGDGAPG